MGGLYSKGASLAKIYILARNLFCTGAQHQHRHFLGDPLHNRQIPVYFNHLTAVLRQNPAIFSFLWFIITHYF